MSLKLGPAAHNAAVGLLEVEMAAELGVIREEYADLESFRAARKAAGLTIEMVRAEKTRRSGQPSSTSARNAGWVLIAIEEEAKGVPMRTALKKADGGTYRERFIHKHRLELQKGLSGPAVPAKTPAVAKAKAEAPVVAKAPAPAVAVAVEAPPAVAKASAPVVAVAVEAPPAPVVAKAVAAKPAMTAKEMAMLASLKEEYDEVELGGMVYLRHKSLGAIYAKGAGVGELGDEMPEWDEDLGEWKSE
jgi:hypothetical protein